MKDELAMSPFELERTARIVAVMATREVVPEIAAFTAVGLLGMGQSPVNLRTRMEIDPEGTIEEGVALLRRHLEIIDFAMGSKDTETVSLFAALQTPDNTAMLRQALDSSDLKEQIREKLDQFLKWSKDQNA